MPNNIKTWFWGLFALLLAVLVVNVVFFVMPMLANLSASFTPSRTMTVSAQGKTTATPDLAEISFSVVSQGKNPTDLTTNDNQKSAAIAQFLAGQNIATSDIATTNYSLSPNYQYDETSERNYITGYTLTDTVEVKIHDLTQVATVLGGLAPLGVNQIGSVDYTFNNTDSLLATARSQAITNAQTKAEQLASEAGVSLGRVISVNESGVIPLPYPYPVYSMAAGSGAMASAPTVNPGTQDVTDNVTITYELR